MLVHVSVHDIALIDHVELPLEPGLTVLTGETGAGKSILVEALLLLLGARASAESVRAGAAEGSVQAQLQIAAPFATEVSRLLREHGLPPLEEGALVLRRVISREGRHKQFVNGALATVAQLKAVAEPLVDFTGQHAHQALVRPGAVAVLLDSFGGHEALLDQMGAAHGRAREIAVELRGLRDNNADKERRLDIIRFYLEEIQALDPEPGEDDRLAAEQRRLKNAAGLKLAVAEAVDLLTDGEDALSRLQRALTSLHKAARDDDGFRPLAASVEEACALVDDVARSLKRSPAFAEPAASDPARLAAVDDRLDALKRLMKKHGGDLASVLLARDQLVAERATLDGASERIDHLESELCRALDDATSVADKLTAKRKTAAKKLARAVSVELLQLGMPAARVELAVEMLAAGADATIARAHKGALTMHGSDRVDLAFSANAGEPLASLSKVASGGELSRVLLAIKRALLLKDPVPVSIFDEVDAGVGGAVAEVIGEKLQAIAAGGRQALVISHLPQIAAKADHHLVVQKALDGGRTVSRVRVLGDDARVDELARMLGGKNITVTTRQHAEEMLLGRIAQRDRPGGKKRSA
jgi:DNA repair protein RecN (Recombination protein N)